MSSFGLFFEPDRPVPSDHPVSDPAIYGSIQIGDFREPFVSSLYYWSAERYVEQWRDAARSLVDQKMDTAFITEITGLPPETHHLFWWFGRPIAGRKCVEQINRLTAVYKQQHD